MTQTAKTQKTVTVLFTYIFKHILRVCFVVLSSDGETRYHTCFDQGRASCTCPAGEKHQVCYHVKQLRPRYDAIVARKQEQSNAPAKIIETPQQDGTIEVVTETGKRVATIRREQQAPSHEGEGKLPVETRQRMMNWHQSQAGDEMEREYEETRRANVRYMYNDL